MVCHNVVVDDEQRKGQMITSYKLNLCNAEMERKQMSITYFDRSNNFVPVISLTAKIPVTNRKTNKHEHRNQQTVR
jgi:hypothetical protein